MGWLNWWLLPKIKVFYRSEWTNGGILTIFKYKNECYKQLERRKVDEKNWVICLVSTFPSRVMVFKLSKKGHFLQCCADLSKKSKPLKPIYMYASERSHYTFSENAMVFRGLSHR